MQPHYSSPAVSCGNSSRGRAVKYCRSPHAAGRGSRARLNACVGSMFYLFKFCVGRASHWRRRASRYYSIIMRGDQYTGQGVLWPPSSPEITFLTATVSLLVAMLNRGPNAKAVISSLRQPAHVVDMCHLRFIPRASDIMESAGVCIMNPE